MAKTQNSFDSNAKKLTSSPKRKRKAKLNYDKIEAKFSRKKENFPHLLFPIYLEPTTKDAFNRAWFRDIIDARKHLERLKLQQSEFNLLKYNDQKKERKTINLQTGYGPSGLPHIGTFGEVARTTMILNAIESIKKRIEKLEK